MVAESINEFTKLQRELHHATNNTKSTDAGDQITQESIRLTEKTVSAASQAAEVWGNHAREDIKSFLEDITL